MFRVIEEHRSTDGLLTLVVGRDETGDVSIGFDGCSWHTHADILASLSGLNEEAAVRQFVDDVLNGSAMIAVARVGGAIRDAWVVDGPIADKYQSAEETVEFRFWEGVSVDRFR